MGWSFLSKNISKVRGLYEMSLFVSETILKAVRHNMAAYELPLSSEELHAIRSDANFGSILDKDVTEIDQCIAKLFSDYHAGHLSLKKFSDQYGVWIRLRKYACR